MLIFIALLGCVNTLPIGENDVKMAMDHLQKYGYMAENKTMAPSDMTTPLMKYQLFMGLNVTGILDTNTTNRMNAPRCGMLDIGMEKSSIASTPNQYMNLTYKILTYPLKKENIRYDEQIEAAFDIWSKYTNFRFTMSKRRPDIKIGFKKGKHRDPQPFDGPGQVVAHAAPEVLLIHFDSEENWSENEIGIDVFQIAAHEIGHILGLNHSQNTESVMYPSYLGFNPSLQKDLHPEDIANIQEIHGVRDDVKMNFMNTDHPLNFNIIFRTNDGLTYIFFDKTYIEYDVNMNESSRGHIHDKWNFLPAKVDAAVQSRKNGKFFFFKGTEYWRYTGNRMDATFPRSIYMGFPGISIAETVLYWREKLYFFYNKSFWESSNTATTITEKNIQSHWPGVPNLTNGAINVDNNTIYFFKRNFYYIFNAITNTTRKENICNLFKC